MFLYTLSRLPFPALAILFLLFPAPIIAQPLTLTSPDGALRLTVTTGPTVTWQLQVRNRALTAPASLSLEVEGKGRIGENVQLLRVLRDSVRRVQYPVVRQKSAQIPERYNELSLLFRGNWGIDFRAYDDGVAYRFFTNYGGEIKVIDEPYALQPLGARVFFPEEDGFYSHNERLYQLLEPADLTPRRLASLPVLLQYDNGLHLLVTETDLQDYPGLWLRGNGKGGLQGDYPRYPRYTVELTRRDIEPTDREPWLARTKGSRNFPWRLFLVGEQAADLLENQLPWLLAAPSRLADADWVRPGKVAWDWWNNLNLYGVDFRAGINTATYQYFVDFAAANGLEYIVLDEGWSEPGELTKINPELDLDALADYARRKNVGIILWVTWSTLDKQFDILLPLLEKWDIQGLKIDFMQRDDQPAVQYYWRMAQKCAENRLLVDFHGAHKPAGLQRTWPNVLSFEGVYGLEQSKWDAKKRIDPEHNVTLPFIRQVAGPMDYTPGAMLNYQRSDWSPSWNRPASLGTRCHELAKYVVFESPLQMLSDSPTNYQREPECLQFLAAVPAVWDTTVALAGAPGDYVAVARRAANGLWYFAAMTDWTERTINLNTNFLPAGEYELEIFADGINADRCAQDYRRTLGHLKAGDPLTVKMAPGGGWVGMLRPVR